MISSGQATPILAGSPQKKHQRGPSFFSSPEKASIHASPTRGMLMGDGYDSFDRRKGLQSWSRADKLVSVLQLVGGIFVILLSMRYAYRFTETTGIFLGSLIAGSGVVGYLGGVRKSSNLINAQVVASIVGILLAFQFMGEVSRDAQVDCALAELYHKSKQTENSLKNTQGIETMQAVFSTLSELQDSISMVKEDAVNMMELRKEQNNLKFTDLNYIRAKVSMVKKHAEEVLGSVLNNDTVSPESIAKMPQAQKDVLRRKLDMADSVLEKITKAHEDGSQDLSIDEYREILLALTDSSVVPELAQNQELRQAMTELPNMEAALDRRRKNEYSVLMVGSAGQQVRKAEMRQMERSKRFENDFEQYMKKSASKGMDFVADLPEHCIRETKGENLVMMSAAAMIFLQFVAVYISLGLTIRFSVKSD